MMKTYYLMESLGFLAFIFPMTRRTHTGHRMKIEYFSVFEHTPFFYHFIYMTKESNQSITLRYSYLFSSVFFRNSVLLEKGKLTAYPYLT